MSEARTKVLFTYIGILEVRGRLLKEIATLQAAGCECQMLFGDRQDRPFKPESFDFPIEAIPTPNRWGAFVLFIRQLWFGVVASKRIAESDASHVVCFALESLLAGALAKRKKPSLKLIFDSNELHVESYPSRVKSFLWARVQRFCVPYCDVIMHAEGHRLDYFKKHHEPGERTHFLLENFPKYLPVESLKPRPSDEVLRVLYVGMLGEDRYTREMIDMFRDFGPNIALDIVGPGTPEFRAKMEDELKTKPAPNVGLYPPVPYADMAQLIEKYHIGIALYRNISINNYYCAPNKVYDLLMSGVPVIANSYPGLTKVLEDGRVGACVDEITPDAFREAIRKIADEKRWENITDDVRRRYSWESQSDGFVNLFKDAS